MEDISRLQQAQLEGLRADKAPAPLHAVTDEQRMQGHEMRGAFIDEAQRLTKRASQRRRIRGKTNPLPVKAEHEAFWDKPLNDHAEELPPRVQAQLKMLGVMEEISNREVHKRNQRLKRQARNRAARKSRRVNR